MTGWIPLRGWLALFFVGSGFCSLVYQVVWLRLAMARFGVTAPMTSIVLSVFMLGIAIGSVLAGRYASRAGIRPGALLGMYAVTELSIGLGAFVVPEVLAAGREAIVAQPDIARWGSFAHYLRAAGWVSAALLPFCVLMGATLPLAMGVLRGQERSERSFSALYAANMLGGAAGALVSAFVLIELLGFAGTLHAAAAVNTLIGLAAIPLAFASGHRAAAADVRVAPTPVAAAGSFAPLALAVLGFVSMAAEVVWIRQFTPFLGNLVYSFATILAIYLVANFLGSCAYRARAARRAADAPAVWMLLCAGAVLPLVAADPRIGTLGAAVRTLLGIGVFCFATGYLTPMLVDRSARGDPACAGLAYACNVLGCIAGPLVTAFIALPLAGERATIAALAVMLLVASVCAVRPGRAPSAVASRPLAWPAIGGTAALMLAVVLFTRDFETAYPQREVRRDYAATTLAVGSGMQRQLLVNGTGMTHLTPITKMMLHLPAAHLARAPEHVLVICFGMGTTFLSALSWGADTTAVELVPGVPELFGYFHADAAAALAAPNARVIIDDGRRLLERTPGRFDLIVIDPPPPINAAGSSLLYSVEFYQLARQRLQPGGILQQWLPSSDTTTLTAFAGALLEVFPHVRAFRSVEGWGLHFLASDQPIPVRTAAGLAGRLPPRARQDLLEWTPGRDAEALFARVLGSESVPARLARLQPGVGPLRDDRPVNEYDFLRSRLEAP